MGFIEKHPVAFIILVLLGLAVLVVIGAYVNAALNVATAPARVINKTLETDNIVQSYEWFYDVNAAYTSRLGQITEFKRLETPSDASEVSRERVELSAVKQTCRELATKYNANSQKMNKSIFKGWSLPDTLDMASCN